jgi:TorA maturation chaperone TorD
MGLPSAALLGALSKAYSYPSEGVEATAAALGALAAEDCDGCFDDVRQVIDASRAFATRVDGQLAYTRLFIGSFKMEAPPYASYYLDGEHLIADKTAAEVRGVYRQFGIELSADEKAPADHIRYLLAFLALMARRWEETGAEAFSEAYGDFRDVYVRPWIRRFEGLVDAYAEGEYYKRLVALTVKVVEQ